MILLPDRGQQQPGVAHWSVEGSRRIAERALGTEGGRPIATGPLAVAGRGIGRVAAYAAARQPPYGITGVKLTQGGYPGGWYE